MSKQKIKFLWHYILLGPSGLHKLCLTCAEWCSLLIPFVISIGVIFNKKICFSYLNRNVFLLWGFLYSFKVIIAVGNLILISAIILENLLWQKIYSKNLPNHKNNTYLLPGFLEETATETILGFTPQIIKTCFICHCQHIVLVNSKWRPAEATKDMPTLTSFEVLW